MHILRLSKQDETGTQYAKVVLTKEQEADLKAVQAIESEHSDYAHNHAHGGKSFDIIDGRKADLVLDLMEKAPENAHVVVGKFSVSVELHLGYYAKS